MELLTIRHRDFTMSIECSRFDAIWGRAVGNVGVECLTTTYTWSEGVEEVVRYGNDGERNVLDNGAEAPAVFFENAEYPVWVEFGCHVGEARFGSMLQEDNEAFSFRRGILAGFINYGNDIGKSEIRIDYRVGTEVRHFCFGFEVLSTKLDYHEHWREIVRDIEKEYRMLSLDYMRRTFHGFSPASAGETPEIVWWSIFAEEQGRFVRAVKSIIDRPHRRLREDRTYLRADRLKEVPAGIEGELAEHRCEPGYLYQVGRQTHSNDTRENRFLKYAVEQVTAKYEALKKRIEAVRGVGTQYKEEMEGMLRTLQRLRRNPFFRTVGRFDGLNQESPVLQKATGYSQVYRTWNLLRRAYSLNDGIYRLQTKDIATLYEIWCFIEVSHIVKELLGEDVGVDHRNRMEMNGVFTWELGKGEHSRILFKRDGVELAELVYNPKHKEKEDGAMGVEDVVVRTVPQKPDIVLQLSKHDLRRSMKMTYLFDAKYRIGGRVNGVDAPPDDAINQMHRYRDAIYYRERLSDELKKEVVGGYILFPGDGEKAEIEVASFYRSINEVNIGAFPLRPKDKGNRELLVRFIEGLVGKSSTELLGRSIPQKGLRYEEGEAIYLVIGVTRQENREDWDRMRKGENCQCRCGFKGPREDVDLQRVKYLAPVFGHEFYGYYRVKAVRSSFREGEQYPARVEFDLYEYRAFDCPVKYGIADAPRGRPFTRDGFWEYCRKRSEERGVSLSS